MKFTSEIAVEYVQHVGDDAAIARAARVSPVSAVAEGVEGLLKYMMQHRHGSPFEHGSLTVRVHAPIKVFREWHRHRVGWSYNEESGRYKQLEPVFYIPPPDRPMVRPLGFKSADPSFAPAHPELYEAIVTGMQAGYEAMYNLYERLLANGVDRGLARDVLGVGVYSSCYCTANPRSIMHFLELRTHNLTAKRPSKPLYEMEVAARKLEGIFAMYWPITHRLWNECGRMAP